TCPTLEAGSVETSSTFFPARARRTADAHAMEVLPTPPLPVKNTNRGGSVRNVGSAAAMKAGTPRRMGIGGRGADLHGQQQVDSPGVQQESLSSASPSMVTPDGGAGTSRPA